MENKKDPTFIDDWFLQRDFDIFDPFRFDQLNAFEKALLDHPLRIRQGNEQASSEKSDLIKPDLDLFDRLSKSPTAVTGSETDELASLKSAQKSLK